MTPAELIRDARSRHGLSQRALALRAGTTQAWISAIERGNARPSVETLSRLLLVMGEELVLDSRPLAKGASREPVGPLDDARRPSPAERLREALSWTGISPGG